VTREAAEAEARTRLSWRRTTLTVTAVTLLIVRLAVVDLAPEEAALFVSLTAAGWLAFLAVAQRRIRRLSLGEVPIRSVPLAVRLILMYEVLGVILVVRSA
jgi:hypothetical protein